MDTGIKGQGDQFLTAFHGIAMVLVLAIENESDFQRIKIPLAQIHIKNRAIRETIREKIPLNLRFKN